MSFIILFNFALSAIGANGDSYPNHWTMLSKLWSSSKVEVWKWVGNCFWVRRSRPRFCATLDPEPHIYSYYRVMDVHLMVSNVHCVIHVYGVREKRPRLDTGVGQAMELSQQEFQHPSATSPPTLHLNFPPFVHRLNVLFSVLLFGHRNL